MGDPVFPGIKVEIPGGPFAMAATKAGPNKERSSEDVLVTGRMPPYQLAKTETTVGQYKAFVVAAMGSTLGAVLSGCGASGTQQIIIQGNPEETETQLRQRADSIFGSEKCQAMQIQDIPNKSLPDFDENKRGDHYPVVGLMFSEMVEFCRHYGGHVATPAEFERAARGKSGINRYGTSEKKAIIRDNGYQSTQPVCGANEEQANDLKVCDLEGNVSEVTSTDPNQEFVELRGRSWYDSWQSPDRSSIRAQGRDALGPDISSFITIGFRCAWSRESEHPNNSVASKQRNFFRYFYILGKQRPF